MSKLMAASEKMAKAHTNLTTYHSIIILLEGGLLSGDHSHDAKNRIITICKREAQRHLRQYDIAASKLRGEP